MMKGHNYFKALLVGAAALAASLLVLVETKPAQAAFAPSGRKVRVW
jgi:hypothetical protein